MVKCYSNGEYSKFYSFYIPCRSQDSVVSILTGYGLDDRVVRV
jgi:hypothetical protein